MSALSTPGGGGTTAQTKPTSGKQKFQKLDINSLYCANRNENLEPSSVKSQLSRKHGMQSLGKVPSARRPPANLPSLKTETGQDPSTNIVSAAPVVVSTPSTCASLTTSTTSNSSAGAGSVAGGWVSLPPPSSPHFRTEFPSLEAAAQPPHRTDHTPQPQLRPQTEGSWTSGGTAGVRQEGAPAPAPAPVPPTQQPPAFRAILPSFLMKGSNGSGLGLGNLGTLRDSRSSAPAGGNNQPRAGRAPPAPRAVEVLTARPILRDEQISSLDDISRDAGWAQHDDIDYDQKLDFSDGESSASNKRGARNVDVERERSESKIQEPSDEDQIWAERRQKQNNEVAQAVARARQRKEEEQRRRDAAAPKDLRDRHDRPDRPPERDRHDNRERDSDAREKDRGDRDRERPDNRDRVENRERADNRERTENRDRMENRERIDNRERDRMDSRDKERGDVRERDVRDKDRFDNRERDRDRTENRDRDRLDNRDRERAENRDRNENRDRFDNRDRDRERDRTDNRNRVENRDRPEGDKERLEHRERERNDNRDRMDQNRFDRDRDRGDRDRERGGDRDRADRDRDRDFRDRDRDYGRDRDQPNTAFAKNFQSNIPPRFLKQQQQSRQQDDHNKGWAFTGKSAPRRPEPQPYTAPRHAPHNARRSYSRDYSDREDDFRREKEGPGPQWRSEMQDYERSGRELDRSNSKDSYKDYGDYKDRRNDSERKSIETNIEPSSRTAADKLTEVFERKSIGLVEPFAVTEQAAAPPAERRQSPPSVAKRESSEKEFGKQSWAEATNDELTTSNTAIVSVDIVPLSKENEGIKKEPIVQELHDDSKCVPPKVSTPTPLQSIIPPVNSSAPSIPITQTQKPPTILAPGVHNQQASQANLSGNIPSQIPPVTQSQPLLDNQPSNSQPIIPIQPVVKPNDPVEIPNTNQILKPVLFEQTLPPNIVKPIFASQKFEKELSESESVASKSSADPNVVGTKDNEANSAESLQGNIVPQKRMDDKRVERISNEQFTKMPPKEPIERKSSGSGSEKKSRGYSGGGGGSYAVYTRGWGQRRRSHRSSRSNNRASESDGSTDGTANAERRDRRRAPRSPRGPKHSHDKPGEGHRPPTMDQLIALGDGIDNRTEPFAPRGQPSRRGRGGFQGSSRPPAPAKRVAGYGPPNTKSPFGQANRANKDNEDFKDTLQNEDKDRVNIGKPRAGSSTGRGRDRRPKGAGTGLSGEDENWETTSEHSEGGTSRRQQGRRGEQSQKGPGSRNQASGNRQNNGRNVQGGKKDAQGDNKTTDITEAMTDLKSTGKKDDEVVDDGFQEVRNKKNSKDTRGPNKDENQNAPKQPRSHSNQGGGRNGSSSRNPNDKSNSRGSAPVSSKPNSQYERPRQANLAPRFVKQRQKQQMGLVSGFGPDTGAAPPPPAVNAWDKPIAQTLRGNVEEPAETVEVKSNQSSQRSTPGDAPPEIKPAPPACALGTEKAGVLDGTTPPVETIIFENTNYKTVTPEDLQQKYPINANVPKTEEINPEIENRPLTFNGDVRTRPRSIQELISDRPVTEGDSSGLGLQMSFDTSQKPEDSSDMKLDFAFDSDLGQLTEDKSAKSLGLPRSVHMSTSNTISPLAADLNLKIASVKKVWEMPAVAEGSEEIQFAGFEENNTETAPPNVCKVKPTQQLQSPPPQHYNHMGYQGGYSGLSVPSPPAVMYNSSQQLLGSSQQLPQQGGLYGAFLDQSRGQFGGFPGSPYGAGSATPYNYQPPPDMFQSLPNQYRMAAAAGGGAAFGQSGQLGNSPSTVLISSTSNSLMSAAVKPSTQQIGAIGSKGAGVGGVGGVGGVSTYQQQYLGYSTPVGEAPYSLQGLLPRPAPPANSYYSPYQGPTAPAPTYPLQFTQPAQSGAFGSQLFSSQLQVAAAVQQMQQQYRAPLQQQYAPPQPRPPPQQLKSPLHEHANGFAPLCDASSPTPKGANKPQKPPHSPPQHKYHAPPPHPPPSHTPHQHHQQQQMVSGNNGRCGNGGGMPRGGMSAPRYPAPIGQRPPPPQMYRGPPTQPPRHHSHPAHVHSSQRTNLYYQQHQRNGGGNVERAPEVCEPTPGVDEATDPVNPAEVPAPTEVKAE